MMVKTISKQTQTNDSKRKVTYIGPVDEESDTWSNNEDDQQEAGEMLYFDKYNTVRLFVIFTQILYSSHLQWPLSEITGDPY